LRGKDDYGIMVLADRRFQKKRSQLPRWIADEILEGQTGLSTDAAVGMAKKFLRGIAQPLPIAVEGVGVKGKDSWDLKTLESFQAEQGMKRGEGNIEHDYMHSDVNKMPVAGNAGVMQMQDVEDEYGNEIDDEDMLDLANNMGTGTNGAMDVEVS